MRVLITGSRGYIGSTLAKTFTEMGVIPVGVDRDMRANGSNIYGMYYPASFEDESVADLVYELKIDTICHLAADASVPDSVKRPSKYYQNNVAATIQLLDNLVKRNWTGKFIFSSSAAVYADSGKLSSESDVPVPCNPYGTTKLMNEHTLRDYYNAYGISIVCFRYFNVAGGWGDVGDHYFAEHVIQKLCRSAITGEEFTIFSDKKNTPDGTCVRDYLHVRDVCDAHVHAIKYLDKNPGFHIYNLGTNKGTSIKQLIAQFITTTGMNLQFATGDPRPGDPDFLVADGHRFVCDTGYTYKHSDLDNIIASAIEYTKTKKRNYGF